MTKKKFIRNVGRGKGNFSLKNLIQISSWSAKFFPVPPHSAPGLCLCQKSPHFRTYFLYMIRYNNISRPPRPSPAPNLGVATPYHPPGLTPLGRIYLLQEKVKHHFEFHVSYV